MLNLHGIKSGVAKITLEKETWLFLAFFLFAAKLIIRIPYIPLLVVFIGLLFILSDHLVTALWFGLIYSLLIRQGIFFSSLYWASRPLWPYLPAKPTITFFILTSDIILITLIYVLKKSATTKPSKGQPGAIDIVIWLIVMLAALSAAFSPLPAVAWFALFWLAKNVLLFYASRSLLTNNKVIKSSVEILLAFGLINAFLIIAQTINRGPLGISIEEVWLPFGRFADESKSLYRPGGISADPNVTASILTMLLPIATALATTQNHFSKAFIWTSLLLLTPALILTASRTAWLIALVSAIFVLSHIINQQKLSLPSFIKKYWALTVPVLALFAALKVIPRLATLKAAFAPQGGLNFRLYQFKLAISFMLKHPLGLGLNVFQYQLLKTAQPQDPFLFLSPAHNIFAQIGAALGFAGLILFVIFVWLVVKKAVHLVRAKPKNFRPLTLGIAASTLTYLLTSQAYPWLFRTPISELFWLMLGGLYAQSPRKII